MAFMKYFAAIIFSILIIGSVAVEAKAYSCSDANAPWNRAEGIAPDLFRCQAANCSGNGFTCISPGSLDFDIPCPNGQSCAREVDCAIAFPGYRCIRNPGVNYDTKPFHCQGSNVWQCSKLKSSNNNDQVVSQQVDSGNDQGSEAGSDQTASSSAEGDVSGGTSSAISFSLSGCCQQIVPPIDHSRENYQLNHLVQVAINVYKCILCLAGSLMILMIVLGGLMMILAAGNSARIAKGKGMIIAAVIGGAIILASILIVSFTVKALGGTFKDAAKVQIDPGK